jgi:hypothetical protein
MKKKILLAFVIICFSSIIIVTSIYFSKKHLEEANDNYTEENPINKEAMLKDEQEKQSEYEEEKTYPKNVDKMISRVIGAAKTEDLPSSSNKKYQIYDQSLYVTNDMGKKWIRVLNDTEAGYARVNDYLDKIADSNIYTSNNSIFVIYGGLGSENISIMDMDTNTYVWSVSTLSQTATNDLDNGYSNLYIDFLADQKIGYIVAIRDKGTVNQKSLVYNSFNNGVTWNSVEKGDKEYNDILAHFGL